MKHNDAYLIMFDSNGTMKSHIRALLDHSPMIEDWVYFMPGVFAVKTSEPKKALYGAIRAALPGLAFYIAELKSDGASGVLPGPVWDMIRGSEKQSA
jgi:hypothetical protein